MKYPDLSILVSEQRNAVGSLEFRTFDWDGPSNGTVLINSEFVENCLERENLAVGEILTLGALRLRIIEFDPYWRDGYSAMLDGWRARVRQHAIPFLYGLHRVCARLILTAVIWGLADRRPAEVPTINHLHIVQWTKRKLLAINSRIREMNS